MGIVRFLLAKALSETTGISLANRSFAVHVVLLNVFLDVVSMFSLIRANSSQVADIYMRAIPLGAFMA